MALCAAWPSLPFINATTDGSTTLHKRHTVRLGGAPIEITIRLRLCGAPLRCKGLFRMTFATVALALLHALLVFPALLAWFGPPEKEE